MPVREGIYGLLAEFDTPSDLVRGRQDRVRLGWRRMDCYTPYPVEEAAEAIGFHRNHVPLVCLVGGLMGLAAMFSMETWISVIAYPLNIAGRPLFSWPAFIVPAYEWTILWAGLSAAFGMLAMNGLPTLYHPLFNAPNFRNGATTDKFFLCLEAIDPKFDLVETRSYLRKLRAGFGGGGGVLSRSPRTRPMTAPCSASDQLAGPGCLCRPVAGCRQDMQDQPKIVPQRGTNFFADGRSRPPPGREHRGPRPVGRRQLLLHRRDRAARKRDADALPGHHGSAGTRPGALQHLLHPLPLARRQRRRHDRAARLQACRQLPFCAHPGRASRPLLLRDDATATAPCPTTPRS